MRKQAVLIVGNQRNGKTTLITTAMQGSQPTVRDGIGTVIVDIALDIELNPTTTFTD